MSLQPGAAAIASKRACGSLTSTQRAGSASHVAGAEIAARCTTKSGLVAASSACTAEVSARSIGVSEATQPANSQAKVGSEP